MKAFKERPANHNIDTHSVSTDEMASIINLHTYMIKMLANGDSLQSTMKKLTLKMEEYFKRETYCSLLMTVEGHRLAVEHAPTLPYEYQQVIHLTEAGPKAGSCGTAVYRKETVISSDIENDPLWDDFRSDALRFGLKACWSIPILISERVVGTFAVYHTEVCMPTAHEIDMLETCANLAGLAIERDRRIKLEQELKENRQRYQSLFYANPEVVYSLDVNGVLLNANLSMYKTLGYTPEQAIGVCWEAFMEEQSLNEMKQHFEKALKGSPQTYEAVGIHQNGQRVMLQITHMPIFVNNQIVGVHGIAKDITESKKVQQEILSLKQQMELVLDSIGDGIYAMNMNREVTLINPAGAKMIGYEAQELMGKTPKDTFRHHYENERCMPSRTLLDGKARYVTDEFFFRRDGTSFPVDYISSPIWKNGEISGVVVAFRDISEKKMAEEYVLKSAKLEMAGQLAAGVAHEIRNPLTCIQGFIRLLEEEGRSELEYFAIIRSEFERIEGIISEFLALAKPQAVNFQGNDVGLILKETIHLMSAQAVMHNIAIVSVIEPSLPFFQCDKHQLKQVFINVIKNAIEATTSKGKLIITCKKTKSHLHIEFQDQGAGIPPERIKHLFEPFYSTKEKGTGLGLMVSYKIIEEHKGIMRIESEEGKGTTVHILLPQK